MLSQKMHGLSDPKKFDRELWLNADLRSELDFDLGKERSMASAQREKMYTSQADAFDTITEALRTDKSGIFSLMGQVAQESLSSSRLWFILQGVKANWR